MGATQTDKDEPILPLAWRVNDAARRLSLSRATLYKLAGAGRLQLVKVAGRTLVPESEIQRLAKGEAA